MLDARGLDVSDRVKSGSLHDLLNRARLFFFERMILPRKTPKLVIETRRKGIDLDRILEEILYPKGN